MELSVETFDYVAAAGWLVSLFVGVGGVTRVVSWIKSQSNVSGRLAIVLTVAVSTFYAIVLAVAQGQLQPEMLAADHIVNTFIMVFALSQAEYLRVKNSDD